MRELDSIKHESERKLTRGKFVFLIFAISAAGLAATFWLMSKSVCLPTMEKKISDPSGLNFRITETDCDSVAKEQIAKVYVSRRNQDEESLLFAYDPEIGSTPSIKIVNGRTIEIVVAHVSSVSFQAKKWQGVNVVYRIGRVEYSASRAGA